MVIVESSGITDIGRKRKNNEDCLFLDDDQRLYVVADGMGGHQAGEVASKLVVETIQNYMKQFREKEGREATPKAWLLSSIHLANQVVFHASCNKNSCQGMGSTVSAVYFTDNTIIAANVGDSPIYLIRDKGIKLLSVTHNLLAEQTAIDPEGARYLSSALKHILTRAIGIGKTVMPDICEIQCFKDDTLVISSDGLSDKVSPEEILAVVNKERPDKACKTLVDLANKYGGDDNITIIILNLS
ncbi:MAG: protein phosphatase 2C domain-containing protein [Desulfobacteraceae bacterium]|nr:protein phosphatase 2C domain-containing protein [Pseudomonadota bacterium]MBU4463504.1 protein phosphatase 2C domain-containing protein [Pseudomonadota bacterium]MCG2755638.1 protein phosphatase 2C domain-containing protein [Desulfobacteraceae bacterium]